MNQSDSEMLTLNEVAACLKAGSPDCCADGLENAE